MYALVMTKGRSLAVGYGAIVVAAVLWGVVGSVGNVLLYVILAAPFADIYRQLMVSDETRATV